MDEQDTSSDEQFLNATKVELEELNGLLVRNLIGKIKDGEATSTDLATAMNLMRTNKVQPTEPMAPRVSITHIDPADFPVQV